MKNINKRGFNLLKSQIESPTIWTKLYDWAVTTARAIMIIVELVVVVSFGFRVVLDLQNKNLEKDIEQKEKIVLVLQESQPRLQRIQKKVAIYSQEWQNTVVYGSTYAEINEYIPATGQEIIVQIDGNEVFINGFAQIADVGEMEEQFKGSKTFFETELLDVEKQGVNDLNSFSLRTKIKEPQIRSDVIL